MGPEQQARILSLGAGQLTALGVVSNSIVSLLLGFCLYGRLAHVPSDYVLLRGITDHTRFVAIVTRTVYFVSRYACLGYLLAQVILIDAREMVRCTAISVYIVASFYTLHLCNHWLFTSRLIAVWHGHARARCVHGYVTLAYLALVGISVANFVDSRYGTRIPSIGCVYVVNWQAYPNKGVQVALCVTGLVFHTVNIVLAMMRLSSFRHTGESMLTAGFSWAALWAALLSVLAFRSKDAARSQQRRTLAENLIEQGFHYWAARTVLVCTLVFLPSFAFAHETLAATIGFAVFIVADVELSGLLYRATVQASRRPSMGVISTVHSASKPHSATTAQRNNHGTWSPTLGASAGSANGGGYPYHFHNHNYAPSDVSPSTVIVDMTPLGAQQTPTPTSGTGTRTASGTGNCH